MAKAVTATEAGAWYRPNTKRGLRNLRRLTQVALLALWLALFLLTRDPVTEALRADLFLITDPLVAAITMGAAQLVVPTALWSLLFVAATLVLGRFFCGWICPLGTLIDLTAKLLKPPEDRFSLETHQRMQRWKYYLLLVTVAAALVSSQWAFLLDPLVLLYRGVTGGLYPALLAALPSKALAEPLRLQLTTIAVLPTLLLIAVLGLTALTPRFYCRYLCPLGALYGLLARASLLRRRVTPCDGCKAVGTDKQCRSGCRMGAVPRNQNLTQNHECIRCFSGRSFCHQESIHFDWMAPKVTKYERPLELGRRQFLLTSATGLALAPVASLGGYHRNDPNTLVRPPRVLDEETFLDQCVRCGMCVQACPTQTLQLTHLEAGFGGLWTPAITPVIEGCKADCNQCGEVCPTDAIPSFSKHEADKWSVKMGTVVFEQGRCISYTSGETCEKCLKICPTKAFNIEAKTAATPRRPRSVNYVRCMGCGLCEKACRRIVFGKPALITFAHGRGQPTVLREQPSAGYRPPER